MIGTGYDQWIHLEIEMEGMDVNALLVSLKLAYPDLYEELAQEFGNLFPANKVGKELMSENEKFLEISIDGRHLYECDEDSHKLFEKYEVKELSEKLNCRIYVSYEGEEKDDAERIEFNKGKKTKHEVLQWVSVM